MPISRSSDAIDRWKANRADFVKHEEWSEANKYHQQQQKLIVHEWNESRKALLVKAEAVFAEAFDLINKQRVRSEEKEKQLRICNELYEKVSRWRNQKLEALEIQQKIDDMIKKQNYEKLKIENENKNNERLMQKKAVRSFYCSFNMTNLLTYFMVFTSSFD